jgi:ribosome modulation factor
MGEPNAHLKPMLDGWNAGLRGTDPRLCPYEQNTAERREWQTWHARAAQCLSPNRKPHLPLPQTEP